MESHGAPTKNSAAKLLDKGREARAKGSKPAPDMRQATPEVKSMSWRHTTLDNQTRDLFVVSIL
eukprot:CAMPEP_0183449762 /NCGR_PEP_ID=MMETSP0370-20130417/110709_1 /TAXON_ID=268820 /ORGANISM="Peridinium aciculiferum, Strain PAER-2" /LENGTH=63 /DNA_ID=CAMNT_0025640871 /DNA_START=31 /DNA_END=223 /DNA_ORIENTATION=-